MQMGSRAVADVATACAGSLPSRDTKPAAAHASKNERDAWKRYKWSQAARMQILQNNARPIWTRAFEA